MTESLSAGDFSDYLSKLTGPIPYPLTNDYMFHMVFQNAQDVLKGLLATLLEIPPEEIVTLDLLNPIVPGETVDEKTIVLDLCMELNSRKVIDIEMQVANKGDWVNRSVFYACRNVAASSLDKGDNYTELKTAVHIGILDFNPPDIAARGALYTQYRLMDLRTFHVYSDKLSLNVLNLSYLDKVPEAERQTDLYKWASLFHAKTWEDLKSLAKGVNGMDNFIFTMAKLSEDDKIRMACRAREDYERDLSTQYSSGYNEGKEEMKEQLEEKEKAIEEKEKAIEEKDRIIAEKEKQIQQLTAALAAEGKNDHSDI